MAFPQGGWVASASKGSARSWQCPLPAELGSSWLSVRFRLSAHGIRRGGAAWQDCRLHLEWFDSQGKLISREFLGSIWGDYSHEFTSGIIQPPSGTHRALIHFENLGNSGTGQLSAFQLLPVSFRFSSVVLLTLVSAGWLAWAVWIAGPWRRWRSWLTGGIWLVAAYFTVLPGPWSVHRPLLGHFENITWNHPAESFSPEAFQPAPSFPWQTQPSNPLLDMKVRFAHFRPLLHGLIFVVPTFILLLLSGPRRVLALTGALALLIEGAQYALGFGFESTDLLDLANDAFGMLAGLMAFALCRRWWLRWSAFLRAGWQFRRPSRSLHPSGVAAFSAAED